MKKPAKLTRKEARRRAQEALKRFEEAKRKALDKRRTSFEKALTRALPRLGGYYDTYPEDIVYIVMKVLRRRKIKI